ncbi:MAG: hypothetical protein KC731_15945 [Myxococcales bacterium]|nr:hypothetical protein [Myxococcales bacterium]
MSLDGFITDGSQDGDGNPVPPWRDLGIQVFLLVADSTESVIDFRHEFALDDIYIAEDDYSMMPVDQQATPVMQLVDPRTMEIVKRGEGIKWDFRDAAVKLAIENATN